MLATLLLSSDSSHTAGVLLLTIVAIEYGGWFMLRVVRGYQPTTAFQQAFSRAGHAHAGVLVILALVSQILADAAQMSGVLAFFGRNSIWLRPFLCLQATSLQQLAKASLNPIALLYCSTWEC